MSKLWYVIETGIIDSDGKEHVDYGDISESTDFEEQAERYLNTYMEDLRPYAEMYSHITENEIVFKRFQIERRSDPEKFVEKIVVIDYVDENGEHDPGSVTIEQLGDIDALIEEAMAPYVPGEMG